MSDGVSDGHFAEQRKLSAGWFGMRRRRGDRGECAGWVREAAMVKGVYYQEEEVDAVICHVYMYRARRLLGCLLFLSGF